MRVVITNPQEFFDEVLTKKGVNLRKFSKLMKINYSAMKKYRRGEMAIPKIIFEEILKFVSTDKKRIYLQGLKELQDNWGQVRGGKISAKKSDINRRMEYARKFKLAKVVNIKLNKFFCEFYGALLGDGCISRYKDSKNVEKMCIVISGNKNLDSDYLKSLKDGLMREYGLYSYFYAYKDKNMCSLIIRNKKFCLDLHNQFEVPIGEKYEKITISKKILRLEWTIKKMVLRGLFDTDGVIFARKGENFRYPHISITSKSHNFLKIIEKMLRERGYPAYINGQDVRMGGISAVNKWFSDIGSSNSRNFLKYRFFAKKGYLPSYFWACGSMVKTRRSHEQS